MKELGYFFAKLRYKLKHYDKEVISDYFRKSGMKIGKRSSIFCNIMTSEPYLIEIGDNVTIAGNVCFVTHDNSSIKVNPSKANLFGYIKIGNNVFIGQNSTIMYGVTLPNDVIVASGSVVVNSFSQERIIIGGNPARIIGRWDSFEERVNNYGMGQNEARERARSGDKSKFITRKIKDE